MWQGHVVSLHIASEASAKMEVVTEARAVPGRGLEGDRYYAPAGAGRAARWFPAPAGRSRRPSPGGPGRGRMRARRADRPRRPIELLRHHRPIVLPEPFSRKARDRSRRGRDTGGGRPVAGGMRHSGRKRGRVLVERRCLLGRARLRRRVCLLRRGRPCGSGLQKQDRGHCDGRPRKTRAETVTLGGTQGAPVIGSARGGLRGPRRGHSTVPSGTCGITTKRGGSANLCCRYVLCSKSVCRSFEWYDPKLQAPVVPVMRR